jgi:hypothetical protein
VRGVSCKLNPRYRVVCFKSKVCGWSMQSRRLTMDQDHVEGELKVFYDCESCTTKLGIWLRCGSWTR